MPVPREICDLVARFEQQLEIYRSGSYNETQLRRDFLDPFFRALGWDIDNVGGYAEAYRDVIHEDAIRIGTAIKAPDYCFRVGGTRKFFVEAKKPQVRVREEVPPAYQLRRYAWSAKLPLSILADFEEFAIYDCRIKPAPGDPASTARIFYCTFHDYAEKWDWIASIFSREAILKGSFDKYAETNKAKRGTAEVDADFLASMEEWRNELARNLALRNPALSTRELNFAVQRILDRIVFLRICEDRGLELYGRLLALTNGPHIYPRLGELFLQADTRYNSGLFHFKVEKGRNEPPDGLTRGLAVDDKLLRDLLKGLYYPESPYEFSVLSADILGQVYEQFLGKVIRLTDGHRAVVEEKPEVRKAGGVYYTPTYIVDYIVRETVGKLLEGKTPKEAAKLHVLDPACGSGSFLIGAYQHLLDWHLGWYAANNPEKWAKAKHPPIIPAPSAGWRLTIAERKQILLNNIHGVDIDAAAVEVTKLSLLLKVLEGETEQTVQTMFDFHHERALPDLGSNIKCGNSLIGPDFYRQEKLPEMDDEERLRLNVFDWSGPDGFPGIMKAGGFDAVIGNPPYGFHQIHSQHTKSYFKARFTSSKGSFEHYFLFLEGSLRKLRTGGILGFIVPVTWLTIPTADSLRRFILTDFAIRKIAWLPALVFKGAQVNTLVTTIENRPPDDIEVLISDGNDPGKGFGKHSKISQIRLLAHGSQVHIFEADDERDLLEKIDSVSMPLEQFARPCSGHNPYEVGKGTAPDGKPHTAQTVSARPYHSTTKTDATWKPEASGHNLSRFFLEWPKARFVKYGPWLAAPRDASNFIGPRILVQEIVGGPSRRIVATFCDQELYHSRDIVPIKCELHWPSPLFLLGILNSRLISWRHRYRSPKARKALFPKVLVSDLRGIPIPRLSHSRSADRLRHDHIVTLVDRMLTLHKQLAAGKTPHEKTAIERQIAATDAEIDRLVYQLYGLTEDEIRIVEEGAAR